MKEYLKNMIEYTSALGFINLIKVTGTDTETNINAIADDRSVIVGGKFKNASPDFVGVFGMPNLPKLKTILSFDEEYGEGATISMNMTTRDGDQVPDAIHFESKNGDFTNDYRLMGKATISEKVKDVTFHGTGWDVEFQPSVQSIQKLKRQASANSEEPVFTVYIKDGNLHFKFGDVNTHSGDFVFESNVSGNLTKKLQFPVTQVISILNLTGDKTFKITSKGAAEIIVDSGVATYNYLLPAYSK